MAKKHADGSVDAAAFLEELNGGPLTFGQMLLSIRRGDEIPQKEFAARLGISKQNLSDIEHDRRNVSVERAAAWAKLLGYQEGQFMRLAIEAQLRAAKLPYDVRVELIAHTKSTKPRKSTKSTKSTKRRAA